MWMPHFVFSSIGETRLLKICAKVTSADGGGGIHVR
jgi:hypothetical protein